MTELFEKAVAKVRCLPPERQDQIGRAMLSYAASEANEPIALSALDRAAIQRGREAARRGEFASDDEICAIWSAFGAGSVGSR